MSRRVADEDDAEEWDGDSGDDDAEEPTVPCPYCGRPIYEDSPRCPHCERYVSAEDPPPRRKPWWLILGLAACFYCVYRWVVS